MSQSHSFKSEPKSIEDSSELTVTTVEAEKPYGEIPEGVCQMLGWHITGSVDTHLGTRAVLLSDPCIGEPSVSEVVKIVSHEFLHDVLEQEVDDRTSRMLDNIVDSGDFVVDRKENGRFERDLKTEYY